MIKQIKIFWIVAIAVSYLSMSCGIVNKNKSSSSSKVDSSVTVVKKQTESQTSDSSNLKTTEKTETKQDESVKTDGLNIQFSKTDSQKITGPVVIKRDSTGTLTVDPGGRSLESITETKSKSKKHVEEVKEKGVDSGRVVKQSESGSMDSTAVDLSKENKADNNHVSRFQIPWYAYLILPIVLFVIGYVVWRFGLFKKRKQDTPLPYTGPDEILNSSDKT